MFELPLVMVMVLVLVYLVVPVLVAFGIYWLVRLAVRHELRRPVTGPLVRPGGPGAPQDAGR